MIQAEQRLHDVVAVRDDVVALQKHGADVPALAAQDRLDAPAQRSIGVGIGDEGKPGQALRPAESHQLIESVGADIDGKMILHS